MRRRTILRGMLAAGGALALGACASDTSALGPGTGGSARLTGGRVSVRWLGGGVVELATPDYKQIAYGDAWFWNNAGWSRFSVPKPPEYATSDGSPSTWPPKIPKRCWCCSRTITATTWAITSRP